MVEERNGYGGLEVVMVVVTDKLRFSVVGLLDTNCYCK
jgi:hypothetical protein